MREVKSVSVKSNHENMMKSNNGIFFLLINETRMKVRVLLGESLNKIYREKK